MIKNNHLNFLLCLLAANKLSCKAYCANRQPVDAASSFRFEDPSSSDYDSNDEYEDFDLTYFGPSYEDVKVFQDTDDFAEKRHDCSVDNAAYYDYFDENDKVTILVDGKEKDYSCKAAKDESNQTIIELIKDAIGTEDIPSTDNDECCDSFRFKSDTELGPIEFTLDASEDKLKIEVSLNLLNIFTETQAQRFKELCEELFICDQYVKYSNMKLCEENSDRRCPSYKTRSLCFGDFYSFDEDERDYRSAYIIGSCLGVADFDSFFDGSVKDGDKFDSPLPINGNAEQVLDTLLDNVAGSCMSATDRSNRGLFEATEDCRNLFRCYQGIASVDDDDDLANDNDVLYNLCGDDTDQELTERLTECEEAGTVQAPSYEFAEQCPGYLQEYFTSFPPDYPYADQYDSYERVILNTVGASGDSRTDGGKLGILKVYRTALAAANVAAEGLRDALPEDFLYFWKNTFWARTSTYLLGVDIVISKYDFHDGNVDGAEIEAFYENTRQLLDGSAALYEAVRCKQPLDEEGAFMSRWGQGCDSMDNDCDRLVDECDEDLIDPIIDTSLVHVHCSNEWFNSIEEAQACVDTYVTAEDDCYTTTVSSTHVPGTSCESTSFEVTANTPEDVCYQSTTVTIEGLRVDAVAPQVSCSLLDGTTQLILTDADGGSAAAANSGAKLVNVGFVPQVVSRADGDCSTNNVKVDIKVFSNELEVGPSGGNVEFYEFEKSAVFFSDSSNIAGPPSGLYLPFAACNGNGNSVTCVRDPSLDITARLYTIRVEAVDEAGNVGSDTCQILIPGSNQQDNLTFDDVAESTQRFLVGEYSYELQP